LGGAPAPELDPDPPRFAAAPASAQKHVDANGHHETGVHNATDAANANISKTATPSLACGAPATFDQPGQAYLRYKVVWRRLEQEPWPETMRVLCFGDSLTAGYYENGRRFHPYASEVMRLLGVKIDHVGLCGYTPCRSARCGGSGDGDGGGASRSRWSAASRAALSAPPMS
jgi:lysophospholipase L1-like esterase